MKSVVISLISASVSTCGWSLIPDTPLDQSYKKDFINTHVLTSKSPITSFWYGYSLVPLPRINTGPEPVHYQAKVNGLQARALLIGNIHYTSFQEKKVPSNESV